jgi:hypothetical protein
MSTDSFTCLKQIPTVGEELIRVSFPNKGQLWLFHDAGF